MCLDNLGVNLYKIQMMYFFKENSDFKAFELIVRLYHQFKDIFINSEPQSLPIPDDAPDDVPRCIWNDNRVVFDINSFQYRKLSEQCIKGYFITAR